MSSLKLISIKGRALLWFTFVLFINTTTVLAESIKSASYTNPVDSYGHFALGRPHEYSTIQIKTDNERTLQLTLPSNEVFEDLAPRMVRLNGEAEPSLLTIISHQDSGARLALISIQDNKAIILANSRPIGTTNRWLNPVGVTDLNSDGISEIAAVITPHIGGNLKVYNLKGNKLEEKASLFGFSNHEYGSSELQLSTPVSYQGMNHLLVPDKSRQYLRVISYADGRLTESGKCRLSKPVSSAIKVTTEQDTLIHISGELKPISLKDCF